MIYHGQGTQRTWIGSNVDLRKRFRDAINLLRFSRQTEGFEHVPHGIRNDLLLGVKAVYQPSMGIAEHLGKLGPTFSKLHKPRNAFSVSRLSGLER